MARVEQGSTQTTVQAPVVQPVVQRPIDFTGVLEAATSIVESKIRDDSAANLSAAIDNYSLDMAKLRNERGDAFGDADITMLNTRTMQGFMQDQIRSGVSVKDINASVTAFKNAQESSDQYEVLREGGFITQIDANGEARITVDKSYGEQLKIRTISGWGTATQVTMNNLKEKDPATYRNVLQDMIATESATDEYNRNAKVRLAKLESIRATRELSTEENSVAIQQSKRDAINIVKQGSIGLLAAVQNNTLQPKEAEAALLELYENTLMSDGFINEMNAYGQNASEILTATRQPVREMIQARIAAVDPSKELTRAALMAKNTNDIFNEQFIADLPESLQRKLVLAKRLEGVGSAMPIVKAMTTDKAVLLAFSHDETIAELGPLLSKAIQPDVSQEDFTKTMNFVERAMGNMTGKYNLNDPTTDDALPVILPEEVESIVKNFFSNPNYEKFVSPARRKVHQELLQKIRANYKDNPRVEKAITKFQDELESSGFWMSIWEGLKASDKDTQ